MITETIQKPLPKGKRAPPSEQVHRAPRRRRNRYGVRQHSEYPPPYAVGRDEGYSSHSDDSDSPDEAIED